MRAALAILLFAVNASAANWFSTPTGAGNHGGQAWTNAFLDTVGISWGSVSPGDTIWAAGGTYSPFAWGTSGTLGNPIAFQRALTASPACTNSPGWNPAFDAQVSITVPDGSNFACIRAVPNDFITIDGMVKNGIKLTIPLSPSGNMLHGVLTVGNGVMIRNIEVVGPGVPDQSRGITAGNESSFGLKDVLTVQYCYLHGLTAGTFLGDTSHILVEHCEIANIQGSGTFHDNVSYMFGEAFNGTYRYNYIHDFGSVGLYWDTAFALNGWQVYGNVFVNHGTGQAVSMDPRNIGAKFGTNWTIVQNTFVSVGEGIRGSSGRFAGCSLNGWTNENNLFYQSGNDFCTLPHDYNWYSTADVWSASEAHSTLGGGGNPFYNPAAGNYHLTANTVSGVTLSDPFTIDPDNVTRIPGAWTRGAYQFVSGTPPATPSNVWPASGTSGVSLTPTLQLSPYFSPSATPQGSAQFWVYDLTETNVLWNSGPLSPRSSASVPLLVLSYSTGYWWSGQYGDSGGLLSAQSPKTLFVTMPNPAPPITNIVILFQGGGKVTLNGSWQSK